MLSAVAEFERELIRERVKAGLKGTKRGFSRKGNKIGKPISAAGPSRSTLYRRAKAAQSVQL